MSRGVLYRSPPVVDRVVQALTTSLRCALLLGLLTVACRDEPQSGGPESADVLVVTGVTVIDVSQAAQQEKTSILIRGNRIDRVGPVDRIPVPENARVYDGSGEFVIPGLWDMHTHVLWSPFVEDGFLRLHLVNGVTGIRDMGGMLDLLPEVRHGGRFHSPLNPRIVAAGPWLNEFIIDPRTGIAVETPEAARQAVATLAEAGVDFIKSYLFLQSDIFLAVLEEAEARGLPVAGHVPKDFSSEEASDLGMRSIEHLRVEIGGLCEEVGEAACPALLDALRENGTWQTPTMVVRRNGALLDQPGTSQYAGVRYAPRYLRDEWTETREGRLANESFDDVRDRRERERGLARAIQRAGLRTLAGSDSGDLYSVPGFSIHEELALLVDAGWSPAEALRAATLEAAEYLSATDSLGIVAEGRLADLVLLDANPLEDIRNTTRIRAVVRDGQLYERADLDRLLEELARRSEGSA